MPTTTEVLTKAVADGRAAATEVAYMPPARWIEPAARAAALAVLEDLHALLFPERHPGYDPEHRFWEDKTDEEIATFAARKAREAELYAPVAELLHQRRHQDAERLYLSLSADFAALGDVEAFQWDSSTIEILAGRIEQLLMELRP